MRPPGGVGPGALVRLASDAGCEGIAVYGACLLPEVHALAAEAFAAGLTMPVLHAPLPEGGLGPGRRLPWLAGGADEREAALDLVQRGMRAGHDLGVKTVALSFGRGTFAVSEAEIRRRFSRRELEEGEAGHGALEALLVERKARALPLVDGCRASLEALLRIADRMEIRLAILPAATPWQVPSPRETVELLEEFAGAPLGVVFSPSRLAVLRTLGLQLSEERKKRLRAAALVVEAADAVGLEQPLPLGLGELEIDELRGFPAGTPFVLSGPADTSAAELAAAIALAKPAAQ